MSIGLVISILLLSTILGLLAKQTLSVPEENHLEENETKEDNNHFHAI